MLEIIITIYALLNLLILVRFMLESRRIDKEYEEKLKEIYKRYHQ